MRVPKNLVAAALLTLLVFILWTTKLVAVAAPLAILAFLILVVTNRYLVPMVYGFSAGCIAYYSLLLSAMSPNLDDNYGQFIRLIIIILLLIRLLFSTAQKTTRLSVVMLTITGAFALGFAGPCLLTSGFAWLISNQPATQISLAVFTVTMLFSEELLARLMYKPYERYVLASVAVIGLFLTYAYFIVEPQASKLGFIPVVITLGAIICLYSLGERNVSIKNNRQP